MAKPLSPSEKERLKKIDDFFNKFEENTKIRNSNAEDFLAELHSKDKDKKELEARRKTRMDRLNERKGAVTATDNKTPSSQNGSSKKPKPKKKKRFKIFKKVVIALFSVGVIASLALGLFVLKVIADSPEIEYNNIYSILSENSVLYDDNGEVLDTLSAFNKEGTRRNIEYADLPRNLINAFISIEDKTFWKHHGFNPVRVLGAIKESFTSGGRIGATSTITQQLARNLYLSDSRTERTLTRKIREAYYAFLLEKHLEKDEILEAYLNTIYFGCDSFGIQAACRTYFDKDVSELDLVECAALASLPKAPNTYAWIKRIPPDDITDTNNENIILKTTDFYYVFNDTATPRLQTCLSLMKAQDLISEKEYETAMATDFKSHIKPHFNTSVASSSYFSDYVVNQAIQALIDEAGKSEEDANQMIYSGGLKIYTTLNTRIQKSAEDELGNSANFPSITNIKKDAGGNILGNNGRVLLYNHSTYFENNGDFVLQPDEFKENQDGSVRILKGGRLNIYKTNVNDITDYNLEFKNLYIMEGNVLYSISGSPISIPSKYKTRDTQGNLILSKGLFKEYPEVFKKSGDKIIIDSSAYDLKQKVIQPQSAVVVTDPFNGGIKAMVGGRNTVGRLLYNRAVKPRQPGSSVKPIGVYGPALQASVDAANSGSLMNFKDSTGVAALMGNYFTLASVIDDTPLTVGGKQWPKNWYPGFRGLYTMRTAIEQSANVPAVRVFNQLGVHRSLAFMKKLNISTIVENGATNDLNPAALALGGMTNGISPLEMSAAYAAFVNDGKYSEPISFTKIVNRKGEILIERSSKSTPVMDPGVAFLMRDVLRTTVTNGLGASASVPNQPAAGKTGTTTDNYDTWFVGFTPQYSAAVWIGNDVNLELNQGSLAAAKLWGRIMTKVCAPIKSASYHPAPANIISVSVDSKSGQLPTKLSSLDPRGTVHSEYFVKGTQPKASDTLHQSVTICVESGFLSTPSCYATRSITGTKRPYTPYMGVGDIEYEVPHFYCPIHNPNPAQYATSGDSPSYKFTGSNTPSENTENPSSGNGNSSDTNTQNTQGSDSQQKPPANTSSPAATPSPPPQGNEQTPNQNTEPAPSTVPDWL
ncbi:MAG: transglycosylase domain-containing protein [Eubacteriales bacterium]